VQIEYSFRFHRDKIPQSFIDKFHHLEHEPNNTSIFAVRVCTNNHDFKSIFDYWEHNPENAYSPLALNKFSESEMRSAEILYLNRIADVPNEMFAEEYGTKYEVLGKGGTGKEYTMNIKGVGQPIVTVDSWEIKKQISPLRINVSKLSKKDIQKTFSDETIISKRLKEILEKNKVTGCKIDPVYRPVKIKESAEDVDYYSDEKKLSKDFYQLNVVPTCGYSVPPTKFGIKFHKLELEDQLEPNPLYDKVIEGFRTTAGPGIGTSFYFNRKNWPNTDFAKTSQFRSLQYLHPFIIISQRLYRILKENKVSGFEAEPAYFVD
jgi:hypothetical protein